MSYPLIKLIVVLGPTSVGKSALAVEIARKFNGEIISADSRQVYRGLNLGTGKITAREMHGINHHMLDIVSPKLQFSVAQYKKLADKAILSTVSHGKLPIICGGTGWYIDTVAENIITPDVPPNPKLRAMLTLKSQRELLEILKEFDAERAKKIEQKNRRRLIRAIEIAKAFGKIPPLIKGEKKYDILYIGLDLEDENLKQNIHARLIARMKRGMMAEAKELHAGGLSWKRMDGLGLEYRYMSMYLQKKISKDKMLEEIKIKSWQYAKRQRTWFRRNTDIYWFHPSQQTKILKTLKDFLKK